MICITGTPGVGKTSVARLLSSRLGLPLTDLNEWLRKHLPHSRDDKRGSDIFDESMLYDVHIAGIVDGHLSHFCRCDIIVLLRCSNQKEHVERMRQKGFHEEKARENMEAEIVEVVAEEARERARETGAVIVEVDTAGKNVDEVVDEIAERISGHVNR